MDMKSNQHDFQIRFKLAPEIIVKKKNIFNLNIFNLKVLSVHFQVGKVKLSYGKTKVDAIQPCSILTGLTA